MNEVWDSQNPSQPDTSRRAAESPYTFLPLPGVEVEERRRGDHCEPDGEGHGPLRPPRLPRLPVVRLTTLPLLQHGVQIHPLINQLNSVELDDFVTKEIKLIHQLGREIWIMDD